MHQESIIVCFKLTIDKYVTYKRGSKDKNFSECGQGSARTQSPTTKNYAVELPPFGVITGVSQSEVQWKGLTLGAPPS